MHLRSGVGYSDSDFDFNYVNMVNLCCGGSKNASELEILFINDFCTSIKAIQKINNQHDKIECILKIYKVIYENRDVILGLHESNERFIQFIEVIYTKSKSVMSSIFNIIPDYNGDLETLLLTIYYLGKTKTFFQDRFVLI